jgi:hypothetical protein
MSHDELDIYHKKLKEKEVIIEKNKKHKAQKKAEEPLPILPDIKEIDGVSYIIRNMKLKFLNIFQNNFTGDCYSALVSILDSHNELSLSIDEKIFSKDEGNILKGKFLSRIYLTKN